MQPHAVKVRLAVAAAGLLGLGCATYTAVKIPGPVADETVALGSHRRDVEGALGTSPESEYRDGDGITAATPPGFPPGQPLGDAAHSPGRGELGSGQAGEKHARNHLAG